MDGKQFSRRALLLLAAAVLTDTASARGGGRGRRGWGRSRGGSSGGLGLILFIAGSIGCIWLYGKFFGRSSARHIKPLSGQPAKPAHGPTAHTHPIGSVKPPADLENLGLCPRCGSTMRRRTVKRGRYAGRTFMGCSTYPNCVGTRKPRLPG
ncbi:topoisomerase DNA-binding C4 zinc finger domain-containing protein [Pseudomonas syringae]|nr:topoisomerase DNA-binding C4 zinc finger domain-containing protein [Pseudomonas syringae]